MTHSLHRLGSEKSLATDYVFLCTPAKGINFKGASEKLLKVLDIVMDVGPTNIGFYGYGSLMSNLSISEVRKNFHDNSRIRCCFDSKGKIKEVLKRIKMEGLGLSITVSGLIKELKEINKELELKPHTINISCGFFGKTERLPEDNRLAITTMCGHGMISYGLVDNVIEKLKEEEMDYTAAVHELGKQCTCGIFNPTRAQHILAEILGEEVEKSS